MNSVFLDTDVILDVFINREPYHREALQLFSILKKKNIKRYTSPIVMANTYYILAKVRNKKYAGERIKKLRKLINIIPVDEKIIDNALQAPYKDFEDSIQYHCVLENNIRFLITRNISDYPKDQINILLPTEYMKILEKEQ